MNESRSFYIRTYGCQMNAYDSSLIRGMLLNLDYRPTEDPGVADLVIINTCSVRDKAEQKVYSTLGRLRPIKALRPEMVISVIGCVAQQEGTKIIERAPFVDVVLGTRMLHRLEEYIVGLAGTGSKLVDVGTDNPSDFSAENVQCREKSPVKAYVTIMRGCDNYCSYCIVPYVRGPEVSRLPESIVREVEDNLARGAKEVMLLGQNVNAYGKGLDGGITFSGLLGKIDSLSGLERIRFTTSHPKDLGEDLVEAFGTLPKLSSHIHLPVQSGSDKVLSLMNRRYGRSEYLEKVEMLRKGRPGIAISTDIIVGFPGEVDTDFEDTLELLERVRYDSIYSFRYSKRRETKASLLDDQVSEETKHERLERVQALQRMITMEKNEKLVGSVMEVLVEGKSRKGGRQLTGRTGTNKVVNLEGGPDIVGTIVPVRIDEAFQNSLRGCIAG